MRIDLHAHYCPGEYLDEWERLATSQDTARSRASLQLLRDKLRPNPALWVIDERFPIMEQAGVDMQVLSQSSANTYSDDDGLNLAMAQLLNDSLAAVCRKHPERFRAVATLPMENAQHAIDELRRCVTKLGLTGVTINGNVRGRPITSEEFLPIYEEINRLKLPIFLHPSTPPGVEAMMDFNLMATAGFIMDMGLAVLRLVYTGIFEKYPDIKLVVPHLGGMLLYMLGRIDNSYRTRPECRVNIPRLPSEYLKRFYYDDVNYHLPSIRCALETVGPDHIVLGSDFPLDLADMVQSVKDIQSVGLSETDQKKIFEDNARRVLGLQT